MKKAEELDLLDLIVRYQDHALDETGISRLNRWLSESEPARLLFQETSMQALKVFELHNGEYAELTCPTQAGKPSIQGGKILGFPVRAWAAAAAVVFIAGLAIFWKPSSPVENPSPFSSSVRVAEARGEVLIIGPDGSVVPLEGDTPMAAGSTISTGSTGSRAALFYSDGTRVWMGPSTELTLAGRDGKLIQLDHGILTSRIARQVEGIPLRFRVGGSEVEVIGTGISLVRKVDEPRVLVHQGRVRVTRLRDGASLEVSGGQQLAVVGEGPLNVEALPVVPQKFHEDFEKDASGWESGKWISAPDGKGAHLRLEPVDYTESEPGRERGPSPIALVMENGTLLQHDFSRQEAAGFHVRDSRTGRDIFLPRNRVDLFSIYGEWTDGNGVFSEKAFDARDPGVPQMLDLDNDGLDDRRQAAPGEPALSRARDGIVRDSKGIAFSIRDGQWKSWQEAYRAELADARTQGLAGWVKLDRDSRLFLRYRSDRPSTATVQVEMFHSGNYDRKTFERELKLTGAEEWQTLEVSLNYPGFIAISLVLGTPGSGLEIDDVRIRPSQK